MNDLLRILLTYAGVACALKLGSRTDERHQRAGLLAAWWAGWFFVASTLAIDRTAAITEMLPASLAVAVWTVVVTWRGGWTWLGPVGLALEASRRGDPSHAVTLLVSVALGLWLARAMLLQRHLIARTLAHWMTFAGTFAWLLPRAIVEHTGAASDPLLQLALVSGLLASGIAGHATRSFVRAGGTPEPWDPPPTLATSGLYSRVRHPIQLAEMLCVLTGLALYPQRWVALYALTFACVLLGPARLAEERRLVSRFGADYLAWQAKVPAYVPRKSPAR